MTEKQDNHSRTQDAEAGLCYRDLFALIDGDFSRYSPPVAELGAKYADALGVSAMAKCLDFNVAANDSSESSPTPFFLVANCRAICEEMIYIAFFRSLDSQDANRMAVAFSQVMHQRSVLAQTRFFAVNNPIQPTQGGLVPAAKQEQELRSSEQILKQLWCRHGFSGSGRVTVRDVSRSMGLHATYDYVYHMTSNYVHFNPTHLFKMGWGPMEGPFTFSVQHFDKYYRDVARFLGAMLFMGYVLMFPERLSDDLAREYMDTVTTTLESGIRWPEIVTFEEMNSKPTKEIMHRALISMIRREDRRSFPNILEELRSLGER